jgi:hypothetical protein
MEGYYNTASGDKTLAVAEIRTADVSKEVA